MRILKTKACKPIIPTSFLKLGAIGSFFTLGLTVNMPASAFDLMSVFQELTDKTTAAFIATTNQTALSSALLSNQIQKTTEMQMAIKQGVKTGERITNILHEQEWGRGVPMSAGCEALMDKQVGNTRSAAAKELTVMQASAIAADHFINSTEKMANRADTHLNKFCDTSETVSGICIPKSNGLGGGDTNYGAWYNQEILDDEHQELAHSYMFNTVDPANTNDSQCEQSVCQELKMQERNFNALSSMVHNTYLQQINDRTILHITPDVSAIMTPTIAASSPAATGATVNPNGQPVSTMPGGATAPASTASTTAATSSTKATSATNSTPAKTVK